jgi:hexosaminidase
MPAQSTYYPRANGLRTLVDGLTGTRYHNGADWCAWAGHPFVLTLTWPESMPVDTVMVGLLSAPGSWIYDPEAIEAEGSADGKSFRPLARWAPGARLPGRADFVLAIEPGQYKALRLSVRPLQRIPDGAVGAGEAAWTFIDEITVR